VIKAHLKVNNITCFAHPRRLLQHLSFEMTAGDSLALVAANWVGNSTLLRTLAGLKTLEIGEIIWTGQGKAYLGHQHGILPVLTPLENIHQVQLHSGHNPDLKLAEYYLDKVGLPKKAWRRFCQTLSAGQRRRVALAQILAKQAGLWLLDEPCAALDQGGQDLFSVLLAEHLQEGGLAIVTGHQPLSYCLQQLHLESYATA
jgi:heme exporter protein A